MHHRRVLIADDNADAADLLACFCRSWGHEVCTARDGLAAVAKSASFAPEIAILDIQMPGMNGYDVARNLREAFGESLLLIALTARDDEQSARDMKAAGFDHQICKAGDIEHIHALVG